MGKHIVVDRKACDGYGNCVFAAPEVFDVDDDNLVVLLTETVTPELADGVAVAVAECPARAIALEK